MTDRDLPTATKRFVIAYIAHVERTGGDVDMAPKWAQDRLAKLALGKLPALSEDPSPTQKLDEYTRAHKNTVLLIEYLRRIARDGMNKAPVLDPVLATLIADALDKGWKKGTFTAIDSSYLCRLRDKIKAMLYANDRDADALARLLRAPMNKKGDAVKKAQAANVIGAHLLGLSGPRAFNALLYPRTGRNKKG